MPDTDSYIEIISEVAAKYQIDIEPQMELFRYIDSCSATLPVIGAFNTGKSSVLNAMLKKPLLPTGIVPQPCPPVEITYGSNSLVLTRNEVDQSVDLNYLREKNADINDVRLAKLYCDNDVFASIENLTLVDLPGYDSGEPLHERWVKDYLINSYNYLLVVAADEPVLKFSFIQLLRSYTTKNKPVFLLITKCDKIPPGELQGCKEYLQKTIKEFLSVEEVHIAMFNEDFVEVTKLLQAIYKYLAAEKKQMVNSQMLYVCYYINTVLKNEALVEDLPLPERHRLLHKHEMQLLKLSDAGKKTMTELKSNVNEEIQRVRKRVSGYVDELIEPIWMLAISSQNVMAFISPIMSAYINKEVYSSFFDYFATRQKNINSLLSLYGIGENYNEIKADDIATAVLAEVVKGEEKLRDDLEPYIGKLTRKIKRQDGEIIINEFILLPVADAIIAHLQEGLQNYIVSFNENILQQIELAKNITDRITKNIKKQSSLAETDINYLSELKIDIINIKHIIDCCNDTKDMEW